jgi:hypothetical protein
MSPNIQATLPEFNEKISALRKDKQMNSDYEQNNKSEFVRWILLVPSAVTGGFLVYSVTVMLNWIATHLNVYPESFFSTILARCVGNLGLGVSTVSIACIIAPFYKKQISILLGSIMVIVSTLFFVISVLKSDYRGVLTSFSILLGSVSTAYFFYKREMKSFKIDHSVDK